MEKCAEKCVFNINGLCENNDLKECLSIVVNYPKKCCYTNVIKCLYNDDNQCTCNDFQNCLKIRIEGQDCCFVDFTGQYY